MMYDGGRAQGALGQLFFVLVLLIGWLILINLFVSILLVSALGEQLASAPALGANRFCLAQGNFMDADKVKPGATLAEAKAAVTCGSM